MRTLYRPVGLYEMQLILNRGLKGFPPRLPEQPNFYSVLSKHYAEQMAMNWNTDDAQSGFSGFVTEWDMNESYINKLDRQIVGTALHEELWVPAEQLPRFNTQIQGAIRLIDVYYGSQYKCEISGDFVSAGTNVVEQFLFFKVMLDCNALDLRREVERNWQLVLLNFKFWVLADPFQLGVSRKEKQRLLGEMTNAWQFIRPELRLLGKEMIINGKKHAE
ncbi:hypothetical protein SAMN03159341_10387 [Paenibacillus sp. 1_12]|uniref:hypothetical protein n=1 Tax=Paenibacillus sp. 1_12 TaxID=1566278 RepID=UPI0008F0D136|nr:hypothetical protein [Paenibacillus sp. 1_12]SFL07672.1 hypothetical protein SAMN03159341_10387 [Paenibacillus sp. 1_12]